MKVTLHTARVFSSSTFKSIIYQTGFAWVILTSSDKGINHHYSETKIIN